MDFVEYCEKQKINIQIINVGKKDDYYNKLNNLKYVVLHYYDYLNSDELMMLYNQTRINILFSGRDCLPRVITESLACGCYNIAMDTLTDGKYLYSDNTGKILSFQHISKVYNKITKSIGYVSDDTIFAEILKYVQCEYDHLNISYNYFRMQQNDNISLNEIDENYDNDQNKIESNINLKLL